MRPRAAALALSSALLLAVGAPSQAPVPTPDTEQAIRQLAQQVADIAGKQAGVLDRLDLLKRRVRLDELMLARIQDQLAATQRAVQEAEARAGSLAGREESARKYLLGRMRQQYALGVLQQYRVYFAVSSTQDLRTAGFYLDYLSRRDAADFKALRDMVGEQERVRTDLEAARQRLAQQADEAARERANLLGEQAKLSELLSRLGQERQTVQAGLDETLAAARAMDRYVTDLSFRSRVEMLSKNMATSRGSLPFPVSGKVTKGFGDFVHPRFRTRVPHPGLDIAAPLGAPVTAVFDGQVEFADWLSGYGYTVILSHPGGFFTIYGHLDQVLATKGATISQGQAVGRVGQSATSDVSGLYFELRQGGKALDPAPWLKGASHAAGPSKD